MSDASKIKNLRYFDFYSKIAGICVNCPDFFVKCNGVYDNGTCLFSSVLSDVLDAMCEVDEALNTAFEYSENYKRE